MAVSIDLPLDPQQVNESGWPWTLLDEAADPARARPGAVLVAGNPSDPVWVRVGGTGIAGDGHEEAGRATGTDLSGLPRVRPEVHSHRQEA